MQSYTHIILRKKNNAYIIASFNLKIIHMGQRLLSCMNINLFIISTHEWKSLQGLVWLTTEAGAIIM